MGTLNMKTVILSLLFTYTLAAQTTVQLAALTVSSEATAVLNSYLAVIFVDNSQPINLTAPVGIADTTINVDSTAGVGAASAIAIEGEAMRITAKTAKTFTVTRAYYGTIAVAHPLRANANELKFATFNRAFIGAIADYVGDKMVQGNAATIATQNAVITQAQAAKVAAETAAVQ